MESSVSLKEPFSYALWPLIVTGVLAFAAIAYLVVWRVMRLYAKKKSMPVKALRVPADAGRIKEKYIAELDSIYMDFTQQKTDIRKAYQRMSVCIRRFVHEATGIRVQNCTLGDIGKMNMPMLYSLVKEYYAPEFAEHSEGDVIDSLIKTRSLIERWR